MLNICLDFWKSKPKYAYKRYAHKNKFVCGFYQKIGFGKKC